MRVYTKDNGTVIAVGESAKENDKLIKMHRASSESNTLWFHAQNASSAHGFLTVPGGIDNATKEEIHECAGLVKWHGRSKSEKTTTIMYCPLMYVTKKGCKTAGQVRITGPTQLVKSWGGDRGADIVAPLLAIEERG